MEPGLLFTKRLSVSWRGKAAIKASTAKAQNSQSNKGVRSLHLCG